MPGFNQQQLQYRARNANSVVILVGDQPVGFAQSVSHTFDFGTQGLFGIGSALPQEIQQMRVQPQITIDSFALTSAGQTTLGQPSSLASVIANTAFNFHIVDGPSGLPIFTYVGGTAANFNENVPANQPVTDSITFLCMDVLDVTGQSILNVGNAFAVPNLAGVASTGLGIQVGPNGVSVGGGFSVGGFSIGGGGTF